MIKFKKHGKPRLRRKQASAYLQEVHNVSRTPQTLAKYASTGGGPIFQKIGNQVFYDPDDLDRYVESLTSPRVTSTAELLELKRRSGK